MALGQWLLSVVVLGRLGMVERWLRATSCFGQFHTVYIPYIDIVHVSQLSSAADSAERSI
jgi:hypothetical protein